MPAEQVADYCLVPAHRARQVVAPVERPGFLARERPLPVVPAEQVMPAVSVDWTPGLAEAP